MKSCFSILFISVFSHSLMSQKLDSFNPESPGKMQVGLSSGYYTNFNDYWTIPDLGISGWGWNMNIRYPLKSILSGKINLFYGFVDKISIQPWQANEKLIQFKEIGLVEEVFDIYRLENGHPDGFWFPNYRNKSKSVSLDVICSVANIIRRIDKKDLSWDIYSSFGIGLLNRSYALNLYDDDGLIYRDLINKSQFDFNKYDTSAGRKMLKQDVPKIFDDSYETDSKIKSINLMVYTFNGGISKNIWERFLIGFEYKRLFYPKSDH